MVLHNTFKTQVNTKDKTHNVYLIWILMSAWETYNEG